MRWFKLSALALAAGSFIVPGCGSEPAEPLPDLPARNRQALLTQAQSCQDLEVLLKADQLAKMNAQIDSMRYWANEGGVDMASDGAVGASGTGGGEDLGTDDGGPASNDHSETNTQVEGVDEADIVKTDGERIYVLHGQELAVVAAYPAADLALASKVAIEGSPNEMFLADGKIVVFSSVDGTQIFQAANLPALDEYCGGYYEGDAYGGCAYYPALTKVTVLALDASGANASVERELWFEGSYNSSRRVDDNVRLVLSGGEHGPQLEYWPSYDAPPPDSPEEWQWQLESMRDKNAAKIAASKLADYLPHHFVRAGGNVQAIPTDCSGYLVPTEGTTEWGMTQIHAFELASPEKAPHTTSVVGYTSTIHSNADSMYLASQGWRDPYYSTFGVADVLVSTSYTHIHKFDLTADRSKPAYVASGTVDGAVHNQFSLDEHDGVLRVATTDWLQSPDESESRNHVFLMSDAGGSLEVLGALEHLAPGESIQSARFLGERGYVVTFRQVDPLFVLDLANPTDPKIEAELKIPGFSSYMHPLGDDGMHLLTVGSEATDDGQVTGLSVQIFDVTDAKAPALAHKYVIPNASSDVGWDHKGFTLYEGTLAIPVWGWGDSDGWWSTLELFAIDAGAGIQKKGSIDHSPFFANVDENGYCYGYYGFDVRRSVFIEEALYSISYGGLIASDSTSLATLATLPLDQPIAPQDCGYGEDF